MAISKRKSAKGGTKYRVQVNVPGLGRVSRTFSRKVDADAWAKRTEVEVEKGEFLPQADARKRTLSELVDRYLANRRAHGRFDERRAAQLKWWTDRAGTLKLSNFTPAKVAELRDALANGDSPSGKPVGPATVNRYLAALSHAMRYGTRELGWLESNVVSRVSRPTEPRGRVRYLDRDTELPRLMAACRAATDSRLFPLVLFALGTGARQAELLSIKWADVDEVRGFAVLQHTKNGDRRSLALNAPAREALAILRRVRVLGSEHIFAASQSPAGAAPTFTATLRESWEQAISEAGIADFRFHDLRHSAASYAAMTGATLPELAAFLGHKTLAMVQRYSHLSPGHMKGVADRMAAAYLSGVGESSS